MWSNDEQNQKMLRNSKDKSSSNFQAKQEGAVINNSGAFDGKYSSGNNKAAAAAAASASTTTTKITSSRQWSSGFRNPRIVRVSRSFGGKDRHSKVCTIRGLRDRRIRLSVPTAIQLYDLQDKLKLGQPSKVIDWLLEVTKLDIEKLPPLQIPSGFSQFHHQMLFPSYHDSSSSSSPQFSFPPYVDFKDPSHFKVDVENQTLPTTMAAEKSKFWDIDLAAAAAAAAAATREKNSNNNTDSSSVVIQRSNGASNSSEKGKWINYNLDQIEDYNTSQQLSAQKLFPIIANNNHHSSLPNYNLFNNYYNSDHHHHQAAAAATAAAASSGLSLSQIGNYNNGVFPSNSIFTTPNYYPAASYMANNNPFAESHIQFLSSNNNNHSAAIHNPFVMPSGFQPFISSPNLKHFPANNFNFFKQLHSENNGGKDNHGNGMAGDHDHHS